MSAQPGSFMGRSSACNRSRNPWRSARVVVVGSSVTNSRCISESNRVFTPPRRHILHLLCSALMSYDKLLWPAASALLTVKIYPTDVVSSLTTRGVTGSNLSKCSGSSLVVLYRFRLRSNEPLSRSLQPLQHKPAFSFERSYPRPAAPPPKSHSVESRSLQNLVLLNPRDR